jgi:hypothetical protein
MSEEGKFPSDWFRLLKEREYGLLFFDRDELEEVIREGKDSTRWAYAVVIREILRNPGFVGYDQEERDFAELRLLPMIGVSSAVKRKMMVSLLLQGFIELKDIAECLNETQKVRKLVRRFFERPPVFTCGKIEKVEESDVLELTKIEWKDGLDIFASE